MHRLILFRHAKAEARAESGEDIDRSLSDRGRRDAAAMARLLARMGLIPDLALVSPSSRTQETWTLAAPAFPTTRLKIVDQLYNAECDEIDEAVRAAAPDAGTVMVVAHNPGLQELSINLLIDGAAAHSQIEQVSAGFPTSTAAVFSINTEGRAMLEGVFGPRDLASDEPPTLPGVSA